MPVINLYCSGQLKRLRLWNDQDTTFYMRNSDGRNISGLSKLA